MSLIPDVKIKIIPVTDKLSVYQITNLSELVIYFNELEELSNIVLNELSLVKLMCAGIIGNNHSYRNRNKYIIRSYYEDHFIHDHMYGNLINIKNRIINNAIDMRKWI